MVLETIAIAAMRHPHMVERGIYIEASKTRWRASPRYRASLYRPPLEEETRFELAEVLSSPPFQDGALNHSATLPFIYKNSIFYVLIIIIINTLVSWIGHFKSTIWTKIS